MEKENNPFDKITSNLEFDPAIVELDRRAREAEYNKRDYLIHRVFSQTEDGRELLKNWMDAIIINTAVIKRGESHDLIEIGIAQGMQDFVRGIYLTCQKIDKEGEK